MRPVREKARAVLKGAKNPLSIDAVRFRAEIKSWSTARALLLEMLAEGTIRGMKTSRGWIFWMSRSESEGVRRNEGGQ